MNTSQQVGGALGLAVLTTLATSRTDGMLADGESTAAALTSGYHLAWWVGAGLAVAALVIAFGVLQREAVAEAGIDLVAPEPAEIEEARSKAA